MAKKYERPVILKVQTGMMNKFGSSPYYTRKIRTEIDGVAINDLVEQFGSPLFVFPRQLCDKNIVLIIIHSLLVILILLSVGHIKQIICPQFVRFFIKKVRSQKLFPRWNMIRQEHSKYQGTKLFLTGPIKIYALLKKR